MKLKPCGTRAAYARHLRNGEPACAACLRANCEETKRKQRAGRPRRTNSRPYKSRSLLEMDADFSRLRPLGKVCAGCSESMSKECFARDRNSPDGRQRRCSKNRCAYLSRREKTSGPTLSYWLKSGVNAEACFYCESGPFEEMDHVIPRCRGGSDLPYNRLPSCESCNRGPGGKLDKPALDWLEGRFPDRVALVVAMIPGVQEDRL